MHKLKGAIEDLLHHQPRTVTQAMDRHFGPGFCHCVNGIWVDRAAFSARIDGLRALVERATITVLDELLDGERYAQRHVIDLHMKDGKREVQEVYVFAQLDTDGRFHRIVEATVVMEPPRRKRSSSSLRVTLDRPVEVSALHRLRLASGSEAKTTFAYPLHDGRILDKP